MNNEKEKETEAPQLKPIVKAEWIYGTVLTYGRKGFGFVSRPNGVDVFFHVSALRDQTHIPCVGDKCHYQIGHRAGREEAVNIQVE